MKISFITTVYNEEKTIKRFLDSLSMQSRKPDEIIIVDGGSSDKTVAKIKEHAVKAKIFIRKGNRSTGRNEAIRRATSEIILCSDAGNVLDKDWVKNISEPFRDTKIDVVAGYYQGRAATIFQKCVIPYALVMPDKVNPQTFLPATRSIAFTKTIWEKAGEFDERLSHNEDYVFAKRLRKINASIIFKKDAIVFWLPRNNPREAFVMFLRFSYGDAEAEIFRPKVALVFLRYLVGMLLLGIAFLSHTFLLFTLWVLLALLYIVWAVSKNYHYVNNWRAIFYLPALQLTADAAVLSGTLLGIISLWGTQNRR